MDKCPWKLTMEQAGEEIICILWNTAEDTYEYAVDSFLQPVSLVVTGLNDKQLSFRRTTPPIDPPGLLGYSKMNGHGSKVVCKEKFRRAKGQLYFYENYDKYEQYELVEEGRQYVGPEQPNEPWEGYLLPWGDHQEFRLDAGTYKLKAVWNCYFGWKALGPDLPQPAPQPKPPEKAGFMKGMRKEEPASAPPPTPQGPKRWAGVVESEWFELVLD